MAKNNQPEAKPIKTPFKTWLGNVVLVLLGAGSFSLWFFMTSMLTWVIVTAIIIRSDVAVTEPTLKQIVDALRYSVRIFGSREPVPAVLTNFINLGLFCFNVVMGWLWVRQGKCGRFALLLLSEFFLIVCFLYALALHIAASPYAATRNSFNIF